MQIYGFAHRNGPQKIGCGLIRVVTGCGIWKPGESSVIPTFLISLLIKVCFSTMWTFPLPLRYESPTYDLEHHFPPYAWKLE